MDTPIIIKKKKVVGHGGHHGGSWKVAYADFVTAMMAFFMVMWIMGLSDETRASIQGYFNDPHGFMKNLPRTKTVIALNGMPTPQPGQSKSHEATPFEKEHDATKKLEQQLKKTIDDPKLLKEIATHVDIQLTPEGLRIEFLEDKNDFFQSGGAVLKPSALKVVKLLGPKIAASGRPIIVEGHTDSVPFAGDPLRNFTLSTERAASLQNALGRAGVPANKFLYVKGLADKELRDPAHPMSAINRRVTILLPFTTPKNAKIDFPKEEARQVVRESLLPGVSLKPAKPNIADVDPKPHKEFFDH